MHTVLIREGGGKWLDFFRSAALKGVTWTDSDPAPDAVVVLPGAEDCGRGSSRTGVVPSCVDCGAAQVITCGMGGADTLTLSSCGPDGGILSLQRDIVTLDGRLLERQEAALPPGASGTCAMVAAGALLVAGVPPAELEKLLRDAPF